MDEIRVGDVHGVFGGRKTDAVGSAEAIGHHADVTRRRVEAVDVLRELRFRPKPLFVAVDGVGEPEGTIRMDHDIVGRIERPCVIVVEKCRRFVWPLGFHVHEACRFTKRALSTEDQTIAIIRATVGHVVALGAANFISREICRGEEFDFGDDDGFVVGRNGIRRGVG